MLVRTPHPECEESPWGYLLRLTAANGYTSPWYIGQLCGLSQAEIRRLHFDLRPVSRATGHSTGALDAISYTRQGHRSCRVAGHVLHDADTAPRVAPVCPFCLDQGTPLPPLHDLSQVHACWQHGVYLVTDCPACERPLTAYRPGPGKCVCGYDLRESAVEPCTEPAERLGLALIISAYRGVSLQSLSPDETPDSLPNPLTLSLPTALRLLPAFYSLDPNTNTDPNGAPRGRLTAHTGSLLIGWPNTFFTLLDTFYQDPPNPRRRPTHTDNLAPVRARFLKGRFPDQEVAFIKNALMAYLETSENATFIDSRTRNYDARRTRWLSISQAATFLNVNQRTVRQMVYNGTLRTSSVRAGRTYRTVIDAHDGSFPAPKSDSRVELRRAGRRSGIPVSVLRTLIDSGRVNAYTTPGRRRCFTESGLDLLMEHLTDDSTADRDSQGDKTTNLQRFLTYSHTDPASKALIVHALLEGTIRPAKTGSTLTDTILRERDISACLRDIPSSHETLSPGFAARLIGCDRSIISSLVDCGYIRRYNKGKNYRLIRSDVEGFTECFAPVIVLARHASSGVAPMTRHCRRQGFKVVSIPRTSPKANYGQPFVEATEAERHRLLQTFCQPGASHSVANGPST